MPTSDAMGAASNSPDERPGPTPEPPATDATSDAAPSGNASSASGMLAPGKVLPPAARGLRAPRASPAVIAQRVAIIQRAMNDEGLTRAGIFQAVAGAQRAEQQKRHQARSTGATPQEAAQLIPVVWGDEPVPERTIEHYMRLAKNKTADEGKLLTRDRTFIIAQQMLRLNDLYRRAIVKGSLQVALNVLREIADTFGLHEAAKVMLVTMAAENQPDDGDASKRAFDLRTDDGRARAMAALMGKAMTTDPRLAKLFARVGADGTTIEPSDAPGVALAPLSRNTNGNGNGKN